MLCLQKINSGEIFALPLGHPLKIQMLVASSPPSPQGTAHFSQTHSLSSITTITVRLDIYYKNVPIFSKVARTETLTDWFKCSPFRVDLLEPKEFVQTSIQYQTGEKDSSVKQLEENITLSWILIDPKRRRAMNLSSGGPVSAHRHWLTGEVVVKFATVMAGDGGEKEFVECGVMVCCGEKEGGAMEVREASLGMEDMEGRSLNGNESLITRKRSVCGEEEEE
ncbi:hypothetical protein SADUNF_Sadunf04G0142800 [Salix dunnii]|uniref:Uncharacterized protein n=1 Tax=Salix dunnii TaxID=1413687 RepID=A0A835KF28_9ROSI|nr:hypothetical protein SADUNF_Sadunf04G0142800 [Salix dunnii]